LEILWLNHIRTLVSEESLCLGTENPIFAILEHLKYYVSSALFSTYIGPY